MAKALRVSRLCIITGVINCIFYFQVSGLLRSWLSRSKQLCLHVCALFPPKLCMHAAPVLPYYKIVTERMHNRFQLQSCKCFVFQVVLPLWNESNYTCRILQDYKEWLWRTAEHPLPL